MKAFHALIAALLFSFSIGTFAQLKPGSVVPSEIMPAGKFYVNMATIPEPRGGFSGERVKVVCDTSVDNLTDCVNASNAPVLYPDNIVSGGNFRIACSLSHMSLDDPIVYVHQSGKSHLHAFVGNTTTGPNSDAGKMDEVGNSTCAGGIINRTGYWVPTLVYECPLGRTDGCDHARDGEVNFPTAMNFYYKCCYSFGAEGESWPLKGHRMIIGSATNTLPNFGRGTLANALPGISRIECYGFDHTISTFDHIPSPAEGAGVSGCDELNFLIVFNACWDGVNLDSANHYSHMASVPDASQAFNGRLDAPCTDPAYPVYLASPILNVHTVIRNQADLAFLRLSSDPPKYQPDMVTLNPPAGYTLHADWANGWAQHDNAGGYGVGTWEDILMYGCHGKGRGTFGNRDWPQFDCKDYLLGQVRGTTKYLTLY
ncbi:MAG: hypothetical protein JWQ89_3557 [Devosia sp.]|uniref:DUF1996 domain-containing protein n=1 Tax=Devosia sp. TaxID=1871048 RepID=UPI002619C9F8|nr:DUF1996 domain-containing protein [Devosia sp.]MDB5541830.1 hypothetical protein [Devosia sp.]